MQSMLKKFRNSDINSGIRNDGTQLRDSQSGNGRRSDSDAPKRLFAIFSVSNHRKTRGAIGGGMTSPDLLDMDLLFNGVDTAHESTQTEASYVLELLSIPSLMTFDVRTDDMSMNGIGAVPVVISGSNNNGTDTGNANTTSGDKRVASTFVVYYFSIFLLVVSAFCG